MAAALRILVVGGTRFIGRAIVERALTAGHEVTLFHRGQSAPGLFPEADHRIGDRDTSLDALAAGEWDATIDTCAYFPRQVAELADALGGRAGRYTFISSVSVYRSPLPSMYPEASPLIELSDPTTTELSGATYGGLKALCERAATARLGTEALIVRPTYVVGPHDRSWRFPWWVTRIAHGGRVLAPGPQGSPMQLIDVRDLAQWIVAMNESGTSGTFHTVGPTSPLSWGGLLREIHSAVAPPGTELCWIDAATLAADGIDDTVLPLWPGGDPTGDVLDADPSAALDSGLTLRPLRETITDTLQWAAAHPHLATGGLDPETEGRLLGADDRS